MRYTIWSRGRLIGETELGFAPFAEGRRSGWFVPNAEGEPLMPALTPLPPGLRETLDQFAADGGVLPPRPRPPADVETLRADLAETAHRIDALCLEVREGDGTVVPTVSITFQDMNALLEISQMVSAEQDISSWGPDEGWYTEIDWERAMLEADDAPLELADELGDAEMELLDDELDLPDRGPAPPPKPGERYQVYVELALGAGDPA